MADTDDLAASLSDLTPEKLAYLAQKNIWLALFDKKVTEIDIPRPSATEEVLINQVYLLIKKRHPFLIIRNNAVDSQEEVPQLMNGIIGLDDKFVAYQNSGAFFIVPKNFVDDSRTLRHGIESARAMMAYVKEHCPHWALDFGGLDSLVRAAWEYGRDYSMNMTYTPSPEDYYFLEVKANIAAYQGITLSKVPTPGKSSGSQGKQGADTE